MPSPSPSPAKQAASPAWSTIALFAFVVLAWSMNWVVMKVAVRDVTPLWAVAIRTAMALAVLLPVLYASSQLRLPPKADYPIILVITLFHMVAFAVLMTAGLTYASAGRTVVLGYTTPLWVAPAAMLFLRERMSAFQVIGIAIGMAGLGLLIRPGAFDWQSRDAVLGHALPLAAALCWSVSIVYTRAHRWTASPLQLLPWQCLLATVVLGALAFNGVIGTALGYWAMTVVSRRVPATTAALGVLATPVVGIGLAAAMLGEGLDPVLMLSAAIILVGLVIGARSRR